MPRMNRRRISCRKPTERRISGRRTNRSRISGRKTIIGEASIINSWLFPLIVKRGPSHFEGEAGQLAHPAITTMSGFGLILCDIKFPYIRGYYQVYPTYVYLPYLFWIWKIYICIHPPQQEKIFPFAMCKCKGIILKIFHLGFNAKEYLFF